MISRQGDTKIGINKIPILRKSAIQSAYFSVQIIHPDAFQGRDFASLNNSQLGAQRPSDFSYNASAAEHAAAVVRIEDT